MAENEEKILKEIQAELKLSNNILGGVSQFLFHFTLWGLVAGVLYGFGLAVESIFGSGWFVFVMAGIVAVAGVGRALLALKTMLDEPVVPKQFAPRPKKPFFERDGVKAWVGVLSVIIFFFIVLFLVASA
jgi:hypothetical protein